MEIKERVLLCALHLAQTVCYYDTNGIGPSYDQCLIIIIFLWAYYVNTGTPFWLMHRAQQHQHNCNVKSSGAHISR